MESKEQFRERVYYSWSHGYYAHDYPQSHIDAVRERQTDGAEAVYVEALRDVIADIGSFTIDRDSWGNPIPAEKYIREYAASLGLDLEDAP